MTQQENKQRVLVFIDWYLPGFRAGGPIRSVSNMIDHLSDEFEFKVITTDTDYMEDQPYSNIIHDQWNVMPNGSFVYYLSKERLTRKNMAALLKGEEFDVVYFNVIYSFWFTLYPMWLLRKRNVIRVLATRGMLGAKSMKIKRFKKGLFFTFAKLVGLFKKVTFHASNQNEADQIQSMFGKQVALKIASNMPPHFENEAHEGKGKSKPLRLVNIGRISPEKNLLYALRVLVMSNDEVTFDFYGPIYDEAYWQECQEVIEQLPQNVSVNYKGILERDQLSATLQQYDFLFFPSMGENFGYAILESLAHGLPVILSDTTPWKDVEVRGCGWEHPLSDPMRFVVRISECASMSEEDYQKMRQAAIDAAQAYTRNPAIREANRQLFLNQ
jgi:glycosyltransferase involved in cell wall biosynthesis